MTTVPITEAIIRGAIETPVKLFKITSAANIIPAIGALKVAEIPAAAPQASSKRTRCPEHLRSCPTNEPNAEPICTMGPSRPTEPPVPIVTADASAFTATTRARIMPPRVATDAITSGTPWPRASGAKRRVRYVAITMPNIGTNGKSQRVGNTFVAIRSRKNH